LTRAARALLRQESDTADVGDVHALGDARYHAVVEPTLATLVAERS
jgi:hypothetical protein